MARRSPTLTLAVVLVVVYVLQVLLGFVGLGRSLFLLSAPVGHEPWTVFLSVYAHGNLFHLAGNVVALLVLGLFLERRTSPGRFHAFFLASGAIAGVTQVWVSGLAGQSVGVLGASGGIFALLGYLLAGNRVTDTLLSWLPLSPRAQLALFLVVAAGVTLATAGPRVALVAHFTGLLIGLLAGRAHLLRPARSSAAGRPAA
jgi:membrane associated rhomboid family serine protease